MAADGDARVDRAGQLQPGLLGDRLVDLQQILSQSREIERGEGQAVEAGLRLGNVDEGFEGAQDGLELGRSEEHTSELQSLMRTSYAVFCLKKNKDVVSAPATLSVQVQHRRSQLRTH